jgi:serine/threonine protein kinase
LALQTHPNPTNTRVLKWFRDKAEFLKEKSAFTTLIKKGKSPEHIIEYLGCYEQGKVYCIILEYADLGTLDDFFRNTPPPRSEEDVTVFFTSLFQLVKGLMSIHQAENSLVG